MRAYYQIWSGTFDDDYIFEPVATRQCTPEDFGIGNTLDPAQKFFKPFIEDLVAF